MLACIHHVSWLEPAPNAQWRCHNCQAVVARREVYPNPDELGPEFARMWEAHEQGEPIPPPVTFLPVVPAAPKWVRAEDAEKELPGGLTIL